MNWYRTFSCSGMIAFSLVTWAAVYLFFGWHGIAIAILVLFGLLVYLSGRETDNVEDN